MSICGKSDFYDWCEMHYTPEHIVNIAEIYCERNRVFICDKIDLIPYYSHLISTASATKDKQYIYLTTESYIYIQNRELLENTINYIISLFNKSCRLHKEFNNEFLKSEKAYDIISSAVSENNIKNIIDVILKYPQMAKKYNKDDYDIIFNKYFSFIFLPQTIRHMKNFIKFAVEHGYNENYLICTYSDSARATAKIVESKKPKHPILSQMYREVLRDVDDNRLDLLVY